MGIEGMTSLSLGVTEVTDFTTPPCCMEQEWGTRSRMDPVMTYLMMTCQIQNIGLLQLSLRTQPIMLERRFLSMPLVPRHICSEDCTNKTSYPIFWLMLHALEKG